MNTMPLPYVTDGRFNSFWKSVITVVINKKLGATPFLLAQYHSTWYRTELISLHFILYSEIETGFMRITLPIF